MNTPKNTSMIQYFLLLFQTLILFAQGVFGNKIAELITVPPLLVLVLSVVSILLILPISVSLAQKSIVAPSSRGIVKALFSRISTAFPFFAILGALGATLFFYLSNSESYICLIPMNTIPNFPIACMAPYIYEVWIFVLLCFLIVLITFVVENLTIILSCAIGFSAGASGAIILLAGNKNEYFFTLGGWILFAILAASIIYILRIPKLITFLTSERKI